MIPAFVGLENFMFDSEVTYALILGVIQGLTEFLPVSSSGHIELAKFVLGSGAQAATDAAESTPEAASQLLAKEGMLMTVVLHFATALSTVVVFRQEIASILRGLLGFFVKSKEAAVVEKDSAEDFWFCFKIVVSMIPAALVGVLLKDQIESLFSGRIVLVGAMLWVTGLLLMLADRAKVTDKPVSILDSILVGIAQAVAILPGISRSGATISTSVLLGIDRTRAAKFSFLMVVPLIFGKMGLDVVEALTSSESMLAGANPVALFAGFLAAFVTGILACQWMIQLVKACQLYWFSIYCFLVGAAAIIAGFMQ